MEFLISEHIVLLKFSHKGWEGDDPKGVVRV